MRLFEAEELELALDVVKRLERLPENSLLNVGKGMELRFYFDGESSGLAVRRDSLGKYVVAIDE